MNIQFLIFVSIVAVTSADKKSYKGYKVYKVKPVENDQVDILNYVQRSGVGEVWEEYIVVGNIARIMVAEEKQEEFALLMNEAKIETEETISDLQKVIDDQLKPVPTSRLTFSSESFHSMTWTKYHTLEEIYDWLDELQLNYPNIIKIVNWGQSVEGRELKGIIIDHHPEKTNKPIGVFESTIHAREWIAPATITWIIKDFLTSDDSEIRALAENFQWHILPIANPDGYAYTFTNNRMWRKNRNNIYNTTCAKGVDNNMSNGVDLNRNFGFQWMVVGASSDPCTNTFAGASAFSEPETKAIVNYLEGLKDDGEIIYYLALHSYTQLVVIPYSHVNSVDEMMQAGYNVNYADMYEIGSRAAAKLGERFGTQYRVGISADILYAMSGTSFDWVKADIDVPVCYLIELRDLGEYGFLLPPEEIIPNNLEIMDFLKEMDRTTRELGYYKSGVSRVVHSIVAVVCGLLMTWAIM